MAKINETNYPRRQASEYAPTDMLILQPVAIPGQEHSGDSRTTRVSDLKEYILGDADPSKIGTPAAGTYTSASNTNAQNIAALDNALANYDHLTKQIATQTEINGYISDPTTASFNVIYLLKDTSATGSDKYYEYMRLGTPEASTFEMTGDTSTDLSDYYTKGEVDTALGNKVNKSPTAGLLKNDGSVDTNSYATSAEAFKTTDATETSLADDDYIPFYDASVSAKRRSLWSNIKSVLKTYFDALYTSKVSSATNGNFAGLDSNGNLTDSGSNASDFLGQVSTMPTASVDINGKVVQYVGASSQDYTHGYFYECTHAMGTQLYYWMNVSVSGGSGSTVTMDRTGTASSSVVSYQRIGIDGVYTEVDGTKYMEQTITRTGAAGDQAFTFTNAAILSTSLIEVFSTNGKSYKSISTSPGSVTVTYAMVAAESLTVRIYIR